MRQHISKIITIILTLILILLLWWNQMEEQERHDYYQKVESVARPLRQEQSRLKQQLIKLEKNYWNQLNTKAYLGLLFTEPSDELLDEIVPVLEEQGLVGTVALSFEQLSGKLEMPDNEIMQKLFKKGWGWCLYYDKGKEDEFSDWLDDSIKEAVKREFHSISAVYFKAGTYSSDFDRLLQEAGISVLIYHGEENLPLFSEKLDGTSPLRKLGACGWNEDRCRGYLDSAISQKTNLMFSIGADSVGELYQDSQFHSMILTLKKYEQQENLTIGGLEQLTEHIPMDSIISGDIKSDYEKKREKLKQRIEELEQEIYSTYKGE